MRAEPFSSENLVSYTFNAACGASIRQGLFIGEGRLIQTLKRSWFLIVQLVEHCSANAEAMGLNPFEVRKFFSGLFAIA